MVINSLTSGKRYGKVVMGGRMNVRVMQAPYTYNYKYSGTYTTPQGWQDMLEIVNVTHPYAPFIEEVDVLVYSVRSDDKRVLQRRVWLR